MPAALSTLLYAAVAAAVLLAAGGAQATPMRLVISVTDITAGTPAQIDVFGDAPSAICGAGCVVTPQSAPNAISIPSVTVGSVQFQGKLSTSLIASNINLLESSALTVLNASATDTYAIQTALVGMNFVGPSNQVHMAASGTWQATGANTAFEPISFAWFDDTTNSGVIGAGNSVGSFTNPAFTGTTQGYSYTSPEAALGNPDSGPFSMSEVWNYTLAPGQELVNRGQTESKTFVAPEPASLALMGVGLLGLGALGRGTARQRR